MAVTSIAEIWPRNYPKFLVYSIDAKKLHKKRPIMNNFDNKYRLSFDIQFQIIYWVLIYSVPQVDSPKISEFYLHYQFGYAHTPKNDWYATQSSPQHIWYFPSAIGCCSSPLDCSKFRSLKKVYQHIMIYRRKDLWFCWKHRLCYLHLLIFLKTKLRKNFFWLSNFAYFPIVTSHTRNDFS